MQKLPIESGSEEPNPPKWMVLSIAPRWVDLIVQGTKKFELRRRAPQNWRNLKALIYATSPECAIRAHCSIKAIISNRPPLLWDEIGGQSGVSNKEFNLYFKGSTSAHALMLTDVVAFKDTPTLAQLRNDIGFMPPQSWSFATSSLLRYVGVAG